MSWSKKTKLNDYEKIMSEFKSDIVNNKTTEQYNDINKGYKAIKKYYEDKYKNEEFDIKIEKIRIERNLGIHHNDMTSFGLTYFVTIIGVIFYFVFQFIINAFDKYNNSLKMVATVFFLGGMFYTVMSVVGKEITKDKPRNLMLNISLKVLKDIEKEEVKKLDIQQRIEQYANVQDEVAATSDIIIDNDQNDKEAKSSGKYIKGFINIIINKRYSK